MKISTIIYISTCEEIDVVTPEIISTVSRVASRVEPITFDFTSSKFGKISTTIDIDHDYQCMFNVDETDMENALQVYITLDVEKELADEASQIFDDQNYTNELRENIVTLVNKFNLGFINTKVAAIVNPCSYFEQFYKQNLEIYAE